MTPTPQEKWNERVRNLRDKECADLLQSGTTAFYTSHLGKPQKSESFLRKYSVKSFLKKK